MQVCCERKMWIVINVGMSVLWEIWLLHIFGVSLNVLINCCSTKWSAFLVADMFYIFYRWISHTYWKQCKILHECGEKCIYSYISTVVLCCFCLLLIYYFKCLVGGSLLCCCKHDVLTHTHRSDLVKCLSCLPCVWHFLFQISVMFSTLN
jgi:hypothetical protein